MAERCMIPNLTNPHLIAAFFPDADPYAFDVSQEEFDEVDGWGPGVYRGVSVPLEEGEKWNAGIKACDAAQIEKRSLQGLRLRLSYFGREAQAETLFETLERERLDPIIKDWQAATEGCELVPLPRAKDWYLVLHPGSSDTYVRYARMAAERAEIRSGWPWIWRDDQYDADFLSAIRDEWRKQAPGWLKEIDGSPSSDATIKALHSHYGIEHHLRGDTGWTWPRPAFQRDRIVLAHKPEGITF